MKDKALMNSIQFHPRAQIYDIDILSTSMCRTAEKWAAGMVRKCHAAMTTFTNPLASLPAHITDGNH